MRVVLPGLFWCDYQDRWPLGDREDAIVHDAGRDGSRYIVWLSGPVYDDLLSDSRHYCDKWGPDDISPALKRSARKTVEALDKGGL